MENNMDKTDELQQEDIGKIEYREWIIYDKCIANINGSIPGNYKEIINSIEASIENGELVLTEMQKKILMSIKNVEELENGEKFTISGEIENSTSKLDEDVMELDPDGNIISGGNGTEKLFSTENVGKVEVFASDEVEEKSNDVFTSIDDGDTIAKEIENSTSKLDDNDDSELSGLSVEELQQRLNEINLANKMKNEELRRIGLINDIMNAQKDGIRLDELIKEAKIKIGENK